MTSSTNPSSPFKGLVAEDRLRELHDMSAAQLRQVLALPNVQKAVHEKAGFLLAKLLERYRVEHYQGRNSDFWRVKEAPRWITVAKLPSRAACDAYLADHGCDALGNLLKDPDPAAPLPAVTPPTKTVSLKPAPPAPKLITGDDDRVVAEFGELFERAQNGLRVIGAFGIYAFDVKFNRLKHGQFGDWVITNYGEQKYRAVRGHMQLTESVLTKECGIKSVKAWIKGLAGQIGKTSANLNHPGELLLLPDVEVPAKLAEIRQKFYDTVDGKSAHQLFLEFKQAEEDPKTESFKPKRGNMTGKGNPKENREKAQQANEKARIEAIELKVPEVSSWLLENADDQHFGQIDETLRAELLKALDTAAGYLRRFAKKGSQQ